MSRSIAYKSVPVKNVSLRFLKSVAKRSTIYVGIDIGKHKLYVSVRWTPPRSKSVVHEHPWFVENTIDIPDLVIKLRKIQHKSKLIVGIESTGTYGDPLRQALHDAGITVHQVRTKVTHDYRDRKIIRCRKVRYETYFFDSVIPCRVGPHRSPAPFRGTIKYGTKTRRVKKR